LSIEREKLVAAMVGAFAAERGEVLRNAEMQRLATLEWASMERRETIAEVRRELAAAIASLRSGAGSSSTTCAASSTWCCCAWPCF
jgi:hypothetical protein